MFAGEEKGSRPLRVASCCAGGDPCLWVARRRGRAVAVFRIAFERWVNETVSKTARHSSESRRTR